MQKWVVCPYDPVACLVKEAGREMERINKKTRELSASGESAEGTELKSDEPQIEPGDEKDPRMGLDAATALEEQLLELAKTAADQREEQLLLLLPVFIQVTQQQIKW